MCKEKVVFLVLSAFFAHVMYGQSQWGNIQTWTSRQKEKAVFLSAYAETGLSISIYHSSEDGFATGLSALPGFNIGAGVNMRFLKKDERSSIKDGLLGLQAGLLYTNSGFKSGGVSVSGNYLCIPVDFQVYPIPGLFIEAGAEMCMSFGFKPETVKIDEMTLNISGHKANDIKIGFGVGYVLNAFPVGIHIKYLIGTSKFAGNLPLIGDQIRISVFYRLGF